MPCRTLALACAALAARSAAGALQPESELTHSCFGFPAKNFNRANCVKSAHGSSPHTAGGLAVGDAAYDFTLSDLAGASHTLSDLLAAKPVVLVWGMWTCPAYQGLGQDAPFDQCSYEDEYNFVEANQGKVTVVHLVGPEPHPVAPDSNFDSGKLLMNYWSTARQPLTYEARKALAHKVADYTHPAATLLVDSLSADADAAANNGVWCTLGLGARTALLLKQDGTLAYKQDWFNAGDMTTAVNELVGGAN